LFKVWNKKTSGKENGRLPFRYRDSGFAADGVRREQQQQRIAERECWKGRRLLTEFLYFSKDLELGIPISGIPE